MTAAVSLDDLAENLRPVKSRGLATQIQLAKATGMDQATISRVLNSRRRRMTRPLIGLSKYVDMLLGGEQLSAGGAEGDQDFPC